MFLSQDLDQYIQDKEKKLRELEIELEKMERMSSSHFEKLEVSPEELARFADNPENFTGKDWEALEEHRQKIDEQLERELSQVKDQRKTAKAWTERNVDPRWLFVR